MFTKIKEFFFGKPQSKENDAPYKVEALVLQDPLVKLGPEPVQQEVTTEEVKKKKPAKKRQFDKKPKTVKQPKAASSVSDKKPASAKKSLAKK